ncbi:hypothetical protein AB7C87_20035 [Natrarchaeobius sp. A-rgal3]|uniref:hypothetical protein n=1 Tax=Natrarchaeobius versutus TaxID=1679078 RepID=UPI00350FE686
MGQRHVEPGDAPTIEQVARRLEAEDVADVARAAFDCAGDLAALEYGRTASVLGACRLASRRSRRKPLSYERLADAFGVDPECVADAEATIASYLTPPADADDVRALRRTLIVAHELLDALECDRLHALELPGSYLADAAPWLIGRTQRSIESGDDVERRGLDEDELRAHVERLEADLELARLGTLLYADVDDVRGE